MRANNTGDGVGEADRLRCQLSSEPLLKFICIKLVVFFVFWQGLVFAILEAKIAVSPRQRLLASSI